MSTLPLGVDVLAVMGAHETQTRYVFLDQLSKYGHIPDLADDLQKVKARHDAASEARAAVAELIDAAAYALRTRDDAGALNDTAVHNLLAALARIGRQP